MSEYIFQQATRTTPPILKEEIVRCRDCKHFTPEGTRVFNDGTLNKAYCDFVRSWVLQIDADGFCAWGERRDA